MEQHLRIYRNHTPACIFGYNKPLFDGETTRPDCSCPLNAQGYLRNVVRPNGTLKRILHRTLETKDWQEARRTAEQWLEWGQPTEPLSDSELLNRPDVTIDQAVNFWFSFSAETHTKGDSAREKYEVLLSKRLKPWANARHKWFIRDFDDSVLVKQFFMSWRNLQPTRNKKQAMNPDKPLALNTKRAELERLRTFLDFCRQNGWVKINYAKPPYIKLGAIKIAQKFAWTMVEYQNIVTTLENWKDRYYNTNPRAERLRAFIYALRYSGQRISDVAMLGPDNILEQDGKFFLALTQIKTGSFVKIPVPVGLVARLRALPILGQTTEPVVLERSNYGITYGTSFWFWTAELPQQATSEKINQVVESNAKNWSDDIVGVLKKTQNNFGKFKHHSTPHTLRHFFALTMLQAGVAIEQVSKWLGHSSPLITARHYSHANSDWHTNSHAVYMNALTKIDPTPAGKIIEMPKAG